MTNTLPKTYRRDCWLGALGAALMMVGDLCLSVIPASPEDSGLFLREAYLSGGFAPWRLPLLLATGILGMSLCFFAVRVTYVQIQPQYRKTRLLIQLSGMVYLASAGVIHLLIGSLADWTSTLSPLLGREATALLIQSFYTRVSSVTWIAYLGMILLILCSAWAVITKKTFLPQKMFLFHMIVWQIVFVMIPDIRQALGTGVSTWDFVLSQASGNTSLLIWMVANAVWSKKAAQSS